MAHIRGGGRTRDLAISLAVLIIPILVIVWVFTRTPDAPTVSVIDWQPVAAQAKGEAAFPIVGPRAVPESWRATRARWTPVGQTGIDGQPVAGDTWQLGFLDDTETYLALDQSNAPAKPFIARVTRQGGTDGTSRIGDETWVRYVSDDERTRSLVLVGKGSTLIVSGDLSYERLDSFAQTVSPI